MQNIEHMQNIDAERDSFEKLAKDSLKKIGDNTWALSSISMWSPEGVLAYNELQEGGEYREHVTVQESDFLRAHVKDIGTFLPERFTVVDLGPGNAEKTVIFLQELKATGKKCKYVGIDISSDMIKKAKAALQAEAIEGEIIQQTFEGGLLQIQKDKEQKLVSILGLTLFSEGLETSKLIKKNLDKKDAVFFTLEPKERTDFQKTSESYISEKTLPFHKATLKLLGLELGQHVDNLEVTDEIAVYVSVKELTSFLVEKGISVGDRIRIGLSYRPTLEEAAGLFEDDAHIASIFDDGKDFVGMLVTPKEIDATPEDFKPPVLDESHPFKRHFEGEEGEQAFKRMVTGSFELLPYLETYVSEGSVMEVGPFYDPLVTKKRFPNCTITYVDRDTKALEFLRPQGDSALRFEFGVSGQEEMDILPFQDAVVTSHIVNHIGLPTLVHTLKDKIKIGGYLFMNESIEYGGEGLMHSERPKSIEEILDFLRKNDFDVLCYRIVPTPNTKYQPNPRLVVAAVRKE